MRFTCTRAVPPTASSRASEKPGAGEGVGAAWTDHLRARSAVTLPLVQATVAASSPSQMHLASAGQRLSSVMATSRRRAPPPIGTSVPGGSSYAPVTMVGERAMSLAGTVAEVDGEVAVDVGGDTGGDAVLDVDDEVGPAVLVEVEPGVALGPGPDVAPVVAGSAVDRSTADRVVAVLPRSVEDAVHAAAPKATVTSASPTRVRGVERVPDITGPSREG